MLKRFFSSQVVVILLTIFLIVTSHFVFVSNTIDFKTLPIYEGIAQQQKLALEELWIKPQTTDEQIDNWLEPHYVARDKSVQSQQKLLVFLSGSFGFPERQQLIIKQATKLGYDAINLRYPNSWTVGRLCKRNKNLDCYGNIRQEILTGIDSSSLIEVNQANSLENRLVKLLQYLNWQQYLEANSPKWEAIMIAGHSQGGAEAFYIAKKYLVAKAIAFAAPVDYNRRRQSFANWLQESSQTPIQRYYGLVHIQDRGFKKIRQAWKLLQLDQFGTLVNVDQENPPYQNSHQLVTTSTPQVIGKYHGSVVVDKATPLLVNGEPLFTDVWNYLLTIPPAN